MVLEAECFPLKKKISFECRHAHFVVTKCTPGAAPGSALPTCPLGGCRVPVVEGAAQNSVFTGLQHDIAAHKPPHRAAAVCQQSAQRRGPRAVVRDPKHQHAQIQQVAVGCVPPSAEKYTNTCSTHNYGFSAFRYCSWR